MQITAAVVQELHGPFVVRDVELDEPGPGEVLVKVAATGFCHTDGIARHGDLPFPLPGVLVTRELGLWPRSAQASPLCTRARPS